MVPAEHSDSLHRLTEAFLTENAKLNLSAFRTEEDCWQGNVLDSLAALDLPEVCALPAGSRAVDLGTGGGFPLLPLALCMPSFAWFGIDATQKKIDAVGRIAAAIGLRNVTLLCGRTEELARDPRYREGFDLVTARAIAPLNTLIEYAAPFARTGGLVIAWKSMTIEEELQDSLLARAELSCHLERTHQYALSSAFGSRQLLIFRKTSRTPAKYPRETGVPKKHPIA